MNSVYSPQVTEEIEALKASMQKLTGDLASATLPPQSFESLRDTFAELLLALHKIPDHTDYQYQYESVVSFTAAIRDVHTCEELEPIVASKIAEIFSANFVALIMRDPQTDESVAVCTWGSGPFTTRQRIAPKTGLIGQVIASGKPYCSAEVSPLATSVHAAIGAPLTTQEKTIGALWITRDTEFSGSEIRLMWLFSDLAAIALHRTYIVKKLVENNSQLANANSRIKELDDLKAKFINDMSHELRTPITGLNMVLYLLERNGQEKYTQYLSNLREEVERLTNFSEGILDVTRLETKMTNAQFESLDFNGLVAQLADIYHTKAERADVTWTFVGADTPLIVTGDHNLLITAVGNMLTNAVNYALHGKVLLQVVHDETRKCATMIVENNGIGVDANELPHLFERFYRGNRVAESSIPGTGLGLAIVKDIVDFHHGWVEAQKTSDGKMRFTLRLPLNAD